MRNSIIAAAFAAALPVGSMAQDTQAPEQPSERTATACTQISATEQFCIAVNNGRPQIMILETPQGRIMGSPGLKIDNEGNSTHCFGVMDRQLNLLGLLCPEQEQNTPAEQPEFIAPN